MIEKNNSQGLSYSLGRKIEKLVNPLVIITASIY